MVYGIRIHFLEIKTKLKYSLVFWYFFFYLIINSTFFHFSLSNQLGRPVPGLLFYWSIHQWNYWRQIQFKNCFNVILISPKHRKFRVLVYPGTHTRKTWCFYIFHEIPFLTFSLFLIPLKTKMSFCGHSGGGLPRHISSLC